MSKFFGLALTNAIFVSMAKWRQKFFSMTKKIFHLFSTLSRTFWAVRRKKLGVVVKTAFYLSTRTFWHTFFGKTKTFSSLSDIERFFSLFLKKFHRICEKSVLYFLISYYSRTLREEFLDFVQIFFGGLWQLHSIGPQKQLNEKLFWKNFFCCFTILRQWAKHFWPYVKTNAAWLSKPPCTCPWGHFDNFFGRIFFPIFLGHWAIFSDLLLESFRRGCKNCILRVH